MKKYKLKKHIKDKLVLAGLVLLLLLLAKQVINKYNNIAQECDVYYNTTCTHYDINQFKNIKR